MIINSKDEVHWHIHFSYYVEMLPIATGSIYHEEETFMIAYGKDKFADTLVPVFTSRYYLDHEGRTVCVVCGVKEK